MAAPLELRTERCPSSGHSRSSAVGQRRATFRPHRPTPLDFPHDLLCTRVNGAYLPFMVPSRVMLTGLVSVALLVTVLVLDGCGQSGSQAKPSGAEQAGRAQRAARTTPEPTPTEPQGKPHPTAHKESRPAGQKSIPGLNAAWVARMFEQQGLRCKQPGRSGTLYNCTSKGNPYLPLLYVGQVVGSSPKQVSSVAAEVVMIPGGGDLASAGQSFFGVIARRMDYRGADAGRAAAFVHKNLSGTDSGSITIGAARWTVLSNADAKVLEVAAAKE